MAALQHEVTEVANGIRGELDAVLIAIQGAPYKNKKNATEVSSYFLSAFWGGNFWGFFLAVFFLPLLRDVQKRNK
jgi:hypothetical protein